MPEPPAVKVFDSSALISAALAADVAAIAKAAIAASGRFTVAISGGSLPTILAKDLVFAEGVEWAKWHVFLADERVVKNTHPDSNYWLIQKELASKVPIPASQIHPIDDSLFATEDGACTAAETAAVATEYAAQLEAAFPGAAIPVFDLILLGMGPDGHTCSLFPGHSLLGVTDTNVAYLTDSPKPPPARITLTFPVLNAAKRVAFVSTGEGKAEVLEKILVNNDTTFPSALVSPPLAVFWYLDKPAAKLLGSLASSL